MVQMPQKKITRYYEGSVNNWHYSQASITYHTCLPQKKKIDVGVCRYSVT